MSEKTEAAEPTIDDAIGVDAPEDPGLETIDSIGDGPVVVPFEPADPDKPPQVDPDRQRRTWPCAEEEKDLCEAAGEALDAAEEKWNQAQVRHNKRLQNAINRTREKNPDMPEINLTTGEKFFMCKRNGDKWEELFEHEVQRG